MQAYVLVLQDFNFYFGVYCEIVFHWYQNFQGNWNSFRDIFCFFYFCVCLITNLLEQPFDFDRFRGQTGMNSIAAYHSLGTSFINLILLSQFTLLSLHFYLHF